jgi:hypothetical protein
MEKAGVVVLILVLVSLAGLGLAADMHLGQSVVTNGIGRASSESHRILCAVGQGTAGAAGTDQYKTQAGCIYQPPQILAGVDDLVAGVSARFRLLPNHPNPFSGSTTVRFCVPKRSHVSLRVYDVRGREVQTLLDREVEPGYQVCAFKGSGLASGVYYCRMVAGRFSDTRKMVVLK